MDTNKRFNISRYTFHLPNNATAIAKAVLWTPQGSLSSPERRICQLNATIKLGERITLRFVPASAVPPAEPVKLLKNF